MRRFELIQPATLEQACAALTENTGAKIIAGGTALLTLIKHGLFVPKTLVNLKQIGTASAISYEPEKGLRIGALASIYDIEASPLVRQNYPVLAEACHVVANIRIRNMATIGGNLAHGDYQSDPPTVLVALDASVELLSDSRTRCVKLSEFLRGSYETALEPGELVSAVVVPPANDWRGRYIKFTTGSSEERPCAGIAALVRMIGDVCADLRLVVGAV
jgi:carbon-monoxide dehydrogenase medium subunit